MTKKSPSALFDYYCKPRFEEQEWRFGRRPTDSDLTRPDGWSDERWALFLRHCHIGLRPPDPVIVPPARTVLAGELALTHLPAAKKAFEDAQTLVKLGVARRVPVKATPELVEEGRKYVYSLPHRTPTRLQTILEENVGLKKAGKPTIPEQFDSPAEWREPDGPVGSAVQEIAHRLEVGERTVQRWLSWEDGIHPEYALRIWLLGASKAYELLERPDFSLPGARAAWWHLRGLGSAFTRRCLGTEALVVEAIAALGRCSSLARYLGVSTDTAEEWASSATDPRGAHRYAVVEAWTIGQQIAALRKVLGGPQAEALGGTKESRLELELGLLDFAKGRQTPPPDSLEAFDYLLTLLEGKGVTV